MIVLSDIILKPTFKKFRSAQVHLIFWSIFISYEVSLAAVISNRLGHPFDYILHYALYIALVYHHCFQVLDPTIGGQKKDWIGLFYRFMLQMIIYFSCGALISLTLDLIQIGRIANFKGARFIYGNIYRLIYMLGISTTYWFFLDRIRNQRRIHRMEQTRMMAEMDKERLELQTEIALLKASVNPHMLFNILNFLYSEVRKTDKTAADHIMALSELMRFALIDISKEKKIMLQDELTYIEHYIHLYKQRIPSNIVFSKQGTDLDFQHKVIPLLLATIMENIFQHGDLTEPALPALIIVTCLDGQLEIRTENRISILPNAGHGLGLANLEKRLQYAYPDSYEYSRHIEGSTYKTHLKINLN